MNAWTRFVLAHGYRAEGYELAVVLGQPVAEIDRVRRTGSCTRLKHALRFAELFALWHGRPPRDDEWPAPRCAGSGGYEWQAPERAVLASLVGRIGKAEIAKILTKRLRDLTGNARARRTLNAVQGGIDMIGMQTKDVVGGITAKAASLEIGSYTATWQAIRTKKLRAFRVGRLWVIPHAAWEAFKAKRQLPPSGFVQLSSIRQTLGIKSDAKLPEFASAGHIPGAVLLMSWGTKHHKSSRGAWWISRQLAAKLIADRRAGRPMPWHGQPNDHNLRVTFKLWRERKHPATCATCAKIWGRKGAPSSFADYMVRYPPLAHGAKRHLTHPWTPGLTIAEVARHVGRTPYLVNRAIRNGVLETAGRGRRVYVTRTDATRWKARRCPTGDNQKSWISLDTARRHYLFTRLELRSLIAQRKLLTKICTAGPGRGLTFVPRHQCATLRERLGFSEAEGARRAGVSIARFRTLLRGANWRGAQGVPLATVQAVIKRIQSAEGYTIESAATKLNVSVDWVHDRILDGTIRVARAKWDRRRLYISEPMLQRLVQAKRKPVKLEYFNSDWLLLSEAANEAGVSVGTIIKWADAGELGRRPARVGWRYHRRAVRARARVYWRTIRFHRAVPPDWLAVEPSSGQNKAIPAAPSRHTGRPSPGAPHTRSQGVPALQAF